VEHSTWNRINNNGAAIEQQLRQNSASWRDLEGSAAQTNGHPIYLTTNPKLMTELVIATCGPSNGE
jgi:hypothetical protein